MGARRKQPIWVSYSYATLTALLLCWIQIKKLIYTRIYGPPRWPLFLPFGYVRIQDRYFDSRLEILVHLLKEFYLVCTRAIGFDNASTVKKNTRYCQYISNLWSKYQKIYSFPTENILWCRRIWPMCKCLQCSEYPQSRISFQAKKSTAEMDSTEHSSKAPCLKTKTYTYLPKGFSTNRKG